MERPYLKKWKEYINEQAPAAAPPAASAATPTDDGKADLIKVLRNHITSMEKDPKWTASGVAQVVYNDAAHWMNKTDMFNDRPGEPMRTKAPFAPEQ